MHRLLRYFKTSALESQLLRYKKAKLKRLLYQKNKHRQSKHEIIEYVSRLSDTELLKLFKKYNID